MIAGLVGGTIAGDPQVSVSDFAKIEEGRPGCISFLANDKYEHYIYTTEISIVLVNSSRAIIYADNTENFAKAAAEAAKAVQQEMEAELNSRGI